LNKSAARRNRRGVRPIARARCCHDALEVNFNGLFGHEELLPDISIPISFSDLAKDVNLPTAPISGILRSISVTSG